MSPEDHLALAWSNSQCHTVCMCPYSKAPTQRRLKLSTMIIRVTELPSDCCRNIMLDIDWWEGDFRN
jgi:hypothetical protein